MKNTIEIMVGLLLCLGLTGFYSYLVVINHKVASPTPISQSTITSGLLDQASLDDLHAKTLNGNLPVVVHPEDLNNPQVFAAK